MRAGDGAHVNPRRRRLPQLGRRLVLPAAVLVVALAPLCAQQPTGKDAKPGDGKAPGKESKPGDGKTPSMEAKPNETPGLGPARPALDKLKFPPDAVIILVDKLHEATELIPKAILVSPEKYQEWQDRIRTLEQQLKGEKSTTHSCKLTGKLDGDYLALRAEFTFATQQAKTPVVLGLQGAHLVDDGDLDKSVPQLDYGDDGFVVRVDKEGAHQLTLNLKVPIGVKRGAGLGSAQERGFELGLPGAPATTLSLELPAEIKDLRINDGVKKSKAPGRWDVPLGLAKQVAVAWKEPQTLAGAGPLLTLEAQIVVKVEENLALLQAELVLEDLRGQAKEWRLLLPPGANPTVKTPAGGAYQWIVPDAKNPWHVLQLKEAASERITVTVQAGVARPTAKLAVGPFAVMGGFRQQGSVLVQATPDALRGQRLVYHRQGEVTQRELPKSLPGVENLAYFQYATVAPSGTTATKPPLELEFKASAGLAETQVDHTLRLKGEGAVKFVETTTRIQAKSLADVTDHLDVQLPRGKPAGLEALSAAPALGFPALVPWLGVLPAAARPTWAAPLEFRWEEEGSELPAPDGSRRVRLRWSRNDAKQFALTIHGKYAVAAGARSVRLELPRPLGSLDRGGSLSVSSGPLVELLTGPPGAEEAAPERHHWQRPTETAPATVDLAWRPHQPTFAVSAVADVVVHGHSAQVKEHLQFTAPSGTAAAPANLRLLVPAAAKQVAVESGGKLLGEPNPDTGVVWVALQTDAALKVDLVLQYDVLLPRGDDRADPAPAPQAWELPLVWPDAATRRDAKVRFWSAPGTVLALAPAGRDWHERGIENVPQRDSLPALVVHGAGANVPLTVQARAAGQTPLASLLCERTLIQVRLDAEGNQFYRARFLVRKLAARQLTLELPVPVRDHLLGDNLQAVRFGPDKQEKALPWNDPTKYTVTIQVPGELPNSQAQAVFLDVEYKVPAALVEVKRFGQAVLHPPRWRGDVLPGSVRWQVDLPSDEIALVVGGGAVLDSRWVLHGWLAAPEASVTGADLEAWLTGREGGDPTPVDLSYWRPGLGAQSLVHLPRQWWLVICSGLVLALGLALYLLPLASPAQWLVVAAACLGVAAAALFWPALLPPLIYGCEPGLAVLLALLGLQWLLQERYRRQVVVMPGFARRQTGSSLSRGQAAKPREPSTVDAPLASPGAVNAPVIRDQ